jgi:hypothetical protein
MCSGDRPLRRGVLTERHAATDPELSTQIQKNVDVAVSPNWLGNGASTRSEGRTSGLGHNVCIQTNGTME